MGKRWGRHKIPLFSNVTSCAGPDSEMATAELAHAGEWGGSRDVEGVSSWRATSIRERDFLVGRPNGDSSVSDDSASLTLRLVAEKLPAERDVPDWATSIGEQNVSIASLQVLLF